MNQPNPARWSGVCGGAYFAAGAVYLGNVIVLVAFHAGDVLLTVAMGSLPVICVVMGALVLSAKRWAPRWSVVVAGGFCAIHLIGLAYLFLLTPPSYTNVTRSLQWQLGAAFVFLWLAILAFAFRLAKATEMSRPAL